MLGTAGGTPARWVSTRPQPPPPGFAAALTPPPNPAGRLWRAPGLQGERHLAAGGGGQLGRRLREAQPAWHLHPRHLLPGLDPPVRPPGALSLVPRPPPGSTEELAPSVPTPLLSAEEATFPHLPQAPRELSVPASHLAHNHVWPALLFQPWLRRC